VTFHRVPETSNPMNFEPHNVIGFFKTLLAHHQCTQGKRGETVRKRMAESSREDLGDDSRWFFPVSSRGYKMCAEHDMDMVVRCLPMLYI
jgi:hypothetical protein